jgi:myo-inositol-1(or 4)-monophosphatase
MIVDALKEACRQVHVKTRHLAGTAQGSRQMGKGAGGDTSRRIDLVAEKTVIDIIRKRGISATIIGEECGRIEGEKKGFVVMDAIDGTTNAIRGVPFYCCSIAYATDFRLSAVTDAAVIDLATGDLYYASRDKGAFLSGKRISTKKENSDPIIGVNMSGLQPSVVERLKPVLAEADHVRQFGANALEMCYLARGFLDAYVDLRGKVRPTDVASACLIAKEAGCNLHSDNGSELDSDLDVKTRLSYVAAANSRMLNQLARHLF